MKLISVIASFVSYGVMLVVTLSVVFSLALAAGVVPDHWNPLRPLDVNAPRTPVTNVQMTRAQSSKSACMSALTKAGIGFDILPDFIEGTDKRCGIANRIKLHDLGDIRLKNVELDCRAALRLAMWMEHDVRPTALDYLGADITSVLHYGSYNCREMRTSSGASGQMSKHATAVAVDISGFGLSDGRRLNLKVDYDRENAFFRRINKRACDWFTVVLGPEYNALHADHFHMDIGRWPVCR